MTPTGWACVDGIEMPLSEATLPLWERSVLQADAVFEVLRTYAGKPHAFDAHLRRLRGSCERVGLSAEDVPPLRGDVGRLLKTAGPQDVALRLWIGARGLPDLSRGDTGTRRAVLATPLPARDPALYERGVEVVTRADTPLRGATDGAKTTNYLSAIVATTAARRQGAHEVVRLGLHGEILEGGSSTVFVVVGGCVYTPPLVTGILPGITRETTLELAQQAGLEAREKLLTCHDLYRADEIFLTSSIREVMPVVRVDGQAVGSGRPGPIAASLLAAYRADALHR